MQIVDCVGVAVGVALVLKFIPTVPCSAVFLQIGIILGPCTRIHVISWLQGTPMYFPQVACCSSGSWIGFALDQDKAFKANRKSCNCDEHQHVLLSTQRGHPHVIHTSSHFNFFKKGRFKKTMCSYTGVVNWAHMLRISRSGCSMMTRSGFSTPCTSSR